MQTKKERAGLASLRGCAGLHQRNQAEKKCGVSGYFGALKPDSGHLACDECNLSATSKST
jgi:hypothetical protein